MGQFMIKMPSYQYKDSHYKDETVMRLSYPYSRDPYTGKMTLGTRISGYSHKETKHNKSVCIIYEKDCMKLYFDKYLL